MKMNREPTASAATLGAVWVIIPVHNRCEITQRLLRHLQSLGVATWATVLVMDDGSSDGTAAMLKNEFPWVQSLRGTGHWWWGGAIRAGMEVAVGSGADCVCWLNDDTLPAAGSLERLVALALERSAVVGGVSQTAHGSGFSYGGGGLVRGWPKALCPMPKADDAVVNVAWLHGNLVAISARVWQVIGLPEVRWAKHHFADVGYTLKAHRAGMGVLLLPSATAESDWNDSGSYLSWTDDQLSFKQLLYGFWNPRMWWYLPAVSYFQIRFFGLRGFLRIIWLITKGFVVLISKGLPK